MTHWINSFLKFGSLDNITDLYLNGTIFMNTIEYFRNLEDNELRGDSYEGSSKITNSLPGTFKIPNVSGEYRYEKIHINYSYKTILGNIYSLYCISSHGFQNPLEFKVDKRNLNFGTHFLMVKNNPYFLEKIEQELIKRKLKFYHGFVEYYNKEKINKSLSIFEKPSEYEYQKEFRFYVENNSLEPIVLRIGSLEKYAQIFEIEDLLTLKLEKNN